MNDPISKSDFKAHALAVLRDIEQTGEPRIITDRGKPRSKFVSCAVKTKRR